MTKTKLLREYKTLYAYDVSGTNARKAFRDYQRQTNKQRNECKQARKDEKQ
jgi:hypothetical protein